VQHDEREGIGGSHLLLVLLVLLGLVYRVSFSSWNHPSPSVRPSSTVPPAMDRALRKSNLCFEIMEFDF
jgi:hypothetical protein